MGDAGQRTSLQDQNRIQKRAADRWRIHAVRRCLVPIAIFLGLAMNFGLILRADDRPNVLLIVADDLGFSDVGFNGCQEIPTPHLDELARTGINFQCGYVSHPYCSPSRAGLLTGRYQQRFGHECNPEATHFEESEFAPGLPLSETTLANVLSEAGYATGAIGKWHLGDASRFWPGHRGFQYWFGFTAGGLSYWGDTGRLPREFGVHRGDQLVDASQLTYLTDDFSSEAVTFIQQHRKQPFFLYLAYNAPHSPDQATREHLEKTQHIEYGGRAVYGAMVAGMDTGIGRVLAALDDVGVAKNTIVVFLSDNGGRKEHAVNFPYRGHKGMLFEGGIRVPFVIRWPARLPSGKQVAEPISALDIFPTILSACRVAPQNSLNLDGVNLLPLLEIPPSAWKPRTFYWRYSMGADQYGYAVRDGDLKLVNSGYKGRKLLFDLEADPWEKNDLSMFQPEALARLDQLYVQWNAGNMSPRWYDPHGANVRNEEAVRQQAIDDASRGQKK